MKLRSGKSAQALISVT